MAKKKSSKPANTRQPIVAILGHVDHGKTTLLDYIRKTHVQEKEAGGITQSIGAYQAEFNQQKITFIDTPGHAAFSKMRSRGANVADIGVLVVAADDGVKPQTIESIKYLKQSTIPLLVVINKIDTPGSSPETVKAQLTEQEIFVEGYGGNTPVVEISAKKGHNIDSFLENILLLAELEELSFKPDSALEAVIIEVVKDQKAGILVNTIVKQGTLHTQQEIASPTASGRVKALYNEFGQSLTSVKPGEPAQILGFKTTPKVGETIKPKDSSTPSTVASPAAKNLQFPPEPIENKFNIILKADNLGSLEAIKGSLSDDVNLILASTGDVTESDIFLASTTGSIIVGFNIKANNSIINLADSEGVILKTYNIIYELLEYLEKKVLQLLEPTIYEDTLGEAEVLKIFEIDNQKIAGCKIKSGTLSVGDTVHLKRAGKIIKDSRIKSLKSGKDEVKKISATAECGILLSPQLDIKINDSIIPYNKNKEEI